MNFTGEQQEILYRAWVLAHDGKGQVLEPWAYPDAHSLAEQGWLERRIEPNGDVSWWWTGAADGALNLGALMQSAAESVN